MTAILALLNNWRVMLGIALSIGILVLWLYISHLRSAVTAAEARATIAETTLEQQQRVNADNLATLDAMKRDHEKEVKALKAERDAAMVRQSDIVVLKDKVKHVEPSKDGDVAAVLSDILNGLRNATGAPGGNTLRTGADTAVPSDVPAVAPGAVGKKAVGSR